jgi:hypothetical protein
LPRQIFWLLIACLRPGLGSVALISWWNLSWLKGWLGPPDQAAPTR